MKSTLAFISGITGLVLVALGFLMAAALAQPVSAPGFFGSTPVIASATGTTAATTATIPAKTGSVAFLCGFSIQSSATAAKVGVASITGLLGGTRTLGQFTAAVANGIGSLNPSFGPVCLPGAAKGTAISVASDAPGAGGNVTVMAWGYYIP